MKKLLSTIALLALAGCGNASRLSAQLTGHATTCIDGVQYVQFASGASVKYTRDGKIETCQ